MFLDRLKIASLYSTETESDKPAPDGTYQKPLNQQVLRRQRFESLKKGFRLVSPIMSIYGRFSSSKKGRLRVNFKSEAIQLFVLDAYLRTSARIRLRSILLLLYHSK